jgi:hypothetical protein
MTQTLSDLGDGPGSRRARTRALARGGIEAVLTDIGRAREAARSDEALQLDRLAALLPSARAAGFSLEQIAEFSGASRPTLNRLREPDRNSWADAELAVLLSLALGGAQTKEQVVGHARGLRLHGGRDLAAAVDVLLARGLLASSQAGHGGEFLTYFRPTEAGEAALRARLDQVGIGTEFRWGLYFGVVHERSSALLAAGEAMLGSGELTFLAPGRAGNRTAEIGFLVRAASRAEAVEKGRRRFAALCRSAGLEPGEVALTVLALEPHLEPPAPAGAAQA